MLKKLIEAVRIAPQAAYALYFDVLRPDPEHMASNARCGIRETCFATGKNNRLASVDLSQWLSQYTAMPQVVTLPFEIANNGVGNATYLHALGAICAASNPTQIVEFGTFLGIGTTTMALNCQAQILTIDLPDRSKGHDIETLSRTDASLVDSSRNRVGCGYAGKPFASRITELRCDSRHLDLRQQIARADLCFIDGGHSRDCIAADTDNALSVLAPGGIVIWDDYFWLYPDVVHYLNELSTIAGPLSRIKGTNLVALRT